MTAKGNEEVAAVGAAPSEAGGKPWALLSAPAVIAVGILGLIIYLNNIELDSAMTESLNVGYITQKILEHIELSAVSTVIVLVVAIPVGIMLSRKGASVANPIILALANVGQGAPAVGVIALLAVWMGIGFWPAIVSLSIYSILPALRNTLVGLEQVDPALIDAGRGLGMSAPAVLFKVELPLAVPVILAGIRTTLVLNVGVGALATFIGAGGLGELVVAGVTQYQFPVLVCGSIMIALLALTIDWLAAIAERVLHPKGV